MEKDLANNNTGKKQRTLLEKKAIFILLLTKNNTGKKQRKPTEKNV
jgi:hypothetical protein